MKKGLFTPSENKLDQNSQMRNSFSFELFSLKSAYVRPFFSVRGETSNLSLFICFFLVCRLVYQSIIQSERHKREKKQIERERLLVSPRTLKKGRT